MSERQYYEQYRELNLERAKDVLVEEDRRPVLYDHKGRPMYRSVGFHK